MLAIASRPNVALYIIVASLLKKNLISSGMVNERFPSELDAYSTIFVQYSC
jgi:hypothetical protein